MFRFDLLLDAKNALEGAIDLDELVAALFADHADLQSFTIEVTNEYDDNNYSDYSRLTRVNGCNVDYDGEYEDEEAEAPEVSRGAVEDAMSITENVKEKFGHGEHEFHRKDYENRQFKQFSSPNAVCALAVIRGEKVPVSVLKEASARWILHHASVHGRLSESDEFELMARKDMMAFAHAYAERFGPIYEKTLNYFILSLKSEDEYQYQSLQKYLEWLKNKAA